MASDAAADVPTGRPNVVVLFGAPESFTKLNCADFFADCGVVTDVKARRSRGGVFFRISFEDESSTAAALAKNGSSIDGEEISVEAERHRPNRRRRRRASDAKAPAAVKPARRRRRRADPKRVFVGGFDENVTKDEVADFFPAATHVYIRRHYAFVTFATEEDAATALGANGSTLKGYTLTVESQREPEVRKAAPVTTEGNSRRRRKTRESRQSRTVFVGNISVEVTREDLFALFPAARRVNVRGRYAFIEFHNDEEAVEALEQNGVEIKGNTAVVEMSGGARRVDSDGLTVYLGNIGVEVKPEDVERLFDGVTDVRLKGRFGFVSFGSEAEATAALSRNGVEFMGFQVVVEQVGQRAD
jgi:RNA recognition motif-containing protein